jgi:uncharacterized membrane protein
MLPKILFTLLLIVALFDPGWRVTEPDQDSQTIAVLSDVSTSMDVEDGESDSRAARAQEILAKLDDELGDLVKLKGYQFDVDVLDSSQSLGEEVRGTDLGRTVVAVSEKPDLSACRAVVLVTDGGDEVVESQRLGAAPIYIVGVGTDPSTWNDLAIRHVNVPAEVEVDAPIKVSAEIRANSASTDFLAKTAHVQVAIEKLSGGEFQRLDMQEVDLSKQQGPVEFELPAEGTEGIREYRFAVKHVDGEMTYLNNERTFQVNVRKINIPVLLYGQALDWNVSLLRRELGKDPSISLTTVYRKNSDVFRIEGSRQDGDEVFRRGFPTDEEVLKHYKCIILGSFRAQLMRDASFEALKKYVEGGGSVIFLGGRDSFGYGGYHRTPIAPLIPWQISNAELEIRAGQYPVMVSPEGAEHDMTSATAAILEGIPSPVFYSVNYIPSLRSGALGLINTSLGQDVRSIVALQPYGKGQTLGVATDTLWRWGRMEGDISAAYHQFWRDAIRYMAGEFEGGKFLTVRWDRKKQLPSEQTVADIRVAGRYAEGEIHLKGEVEHAGETKELSVFPGEDGTFKTTVFFPNRGEYTVTLEATLKGEPLDIYQRTIHVGSELNEGAELAVDHPFLENLAAGSGGYYQPEVEVDQLIERLKAMLNENTDARTIPLVSEPAIAGVLPVFLLLVMFVLLAEWLLRRRMKMV